MKNIFFKAMPGLFQRKKKIDSDNQPFFYDNKVMDSIRRLEQTNVRLVDKLGHLNDSTYKVTEKTEELFQIIDNVKYDQAEEMEKVLAQMSELNVSQKQEMLEMKSYLKTLQKKQQDKIGRQLGDLRSSLQQLKELQDKTKINTSNDHEVLTVLLEGLYKRLDSLQENQRKERDVILGKLSDTEKDIQEKSDVQLEYSKTNSDLLFKMREHHFEYESNQLEEQRKLAELLKDLQRDMKKIEKVIGKNEGLIKN